MSSRLKLVSELLLIRGMMAGIYSKIKARKAVIMWRKWRKRKYGEKTNRRYSLTSKKRHLKVVLQSAYHLKEVACLNLIQIPETK